MIRELSIPDRLLKPSNLVDGMSHVLLSSLDMCIVLYGVVSHLPLLLIVESYHNRLLSSWIRVW
ncbi:hypothetical protein AHF37_10251 [Paragonimus kellicotti]|nr:hypothetical protein AHF37_10251 [Paragonimus kellicotti]